MRIPRMLCAVAEEAHKAATRHRGYLTPHARAQLQMFLLQHEETLAEDNISTSPGSLDEARREMGPSLTGPGPILEGRTRITSPRKSYSARLMSPLGKPA